MGRDVCRYWTFFIPALKSFCMGGGTGCLPIPEVFYPGIKNSLYGRRDGTFADTGRFLSRLENVSTRDNFTLDNLQSQYNIVPAKRQGVFI